jgi:hypothetical protein
MRTGSLLHTVGVMLVACSFLLSTIPAVAQQARTVDENSKENSKNSAPSNIQELPDSPGTVRSEMQTEAQLAQSSSQDQSTQNRSGQDQTQQQSSPTPQKPVGTAAAEAPNVSAIAASQPAGVAIAPAKQHRVRTIVLRTGAILGAAAAVGAVVALSAATPSRPPGAH